MGCLCLWCVSRDWLFELDSPWLRLLEVALSLGASLRVSAVHKLFVRKHVVSGVRKPWVRPWLTGETFF